MQPEFFLILISSYYVSGQQNVEYTPNSSTENPYQAFILLKSKMEIICSGAIINKKHVVTAASCFNESKEKYVILVGSPNYNEGKIHGLKKVRVHPGFAKNTHQNNIALLKVTQNFIFNDKVQRIKLFKGYQSNARIVKHSGNATYYGLETVTKNNRFTKVVKAFTVAEIPLTICRVFYGKEINKSTLCENCLHHTCTFCKEYLGAPLVKNGTLIGISSLAPNCQNEKYPVIFSPIDLFIEFIEKETPNFYEEKRIIMGNPTPIKEVPYIIQFTDVTLSFTCGGVIISELHILTAAHCIVYPNGKYVILAGSDKLKTGIKMEVEKFKAHPKYDDKLNDIAVITLKKKLKLGSTIQKIALAGKNDTYKPGEKATVAGYGKTKQEAYKSSKTLQSVRVPIVDGKTCGKLLNQSPNTICAGCLKGGCDACQGDSGGPLVLKNKLIGLVSYGNGCGLPKNPGVYTDIRKFLDFIMKETNKLKV